MNDNRVTSAAAQECLEIANRCLIESSRTLDREAGRARPRPFVEPDLVSGSLTSRRRSRRGCRQEDDAQPLPAPRP